MNRTETNTTLSEEKNFKTMLTEHLSDTKKVTYAINKKSHNTS